LPTTKSLITWPRAGGSALRAVGVGHASLDVLVEPRDFVRATVEARREPQGRTVSELHRRLIRWHTTHHEDGQKHCLAPESVIAGRYGICRPHEETTPQAALAHLLTATQNACAPGAQLIAVAGEVVVRTCCGYRSQPMLLLRRVADANGIDLLDQLLH